jgi:nucleoside-diphosphate-sugar epimerase
VVSLVTGGSGFIDSHLLKDLTADGQGSARAVVRRAESAPRLQDVDVRIGDVRDSAFVQDVVRGTDVVYHCATASGPGFSPRELHDTPLLGTRNVLEGLRRAGAGRAVLLTGTVVLGARHLDAATEDLPCRRSSEMAGNVKIEIEKMAWDYHQRHNVEVTVLRPGLIYGPGDRRNLPQMVRALRAGRFAYIRDRHNVIPMVYVSDMVQAMRLAARTPMAAGRVYHITDGSRTSIGEFIDYLAELLACPSPRRVIPFAAPYLGCLLFESLAALRLHRGAGPINRTGLNLLGYSRVIDITRARGELGYEPQVLYRDGLPLTLNGIDEQVQSLVEMQHANRHCTTPGLRD